MGDFARVRNPIFTAMIIAQAGAVLMTTSWPIPGGSGPAHHGAPSARPPSWKALSASDPRPRLLDYTAWAGRLLQLVGRQVAVAG